MKIRIDVTNDVIKQAEAWRAAPHPRVGELSNSCVVGRSVSEYLAEGMRGMACRYILQVCGCGKVWTTPTPDEALRLIIAFDSDQPVTPTSFEIDIPEEYLNEHAKEERDLAQPNEAPQEARTEALAHAK